MGWCTGSYIAAELWDEIRDYLPKDKKEKLAFRIYEVFSNQDADCWDNEMNIIKDGKIIEKEGWDEY